MYEVCPFFLHQGRAAKLEQTVTWYVSADPKTNNEARDLFSGKKEYVLRMCKALGFIRDRWTDKHTVLLRK